MSRANFYKFQSDITFLLIVSVLVAYSLLIISLWKLISPRISFYSEILLNKCIQIWDTISIGDLIVISSVVIILAGLIARALISLIRMFLGIIKTKNFISTLQILEDTKEYVVFDSNEKTSFVYGFVKPKMYISTGMINSLSQKELSAVLLHEEGHIKYFHNIKKVMAFFILEMLPLLPARAALKRGFNNINEIASDEYCYRIIGSRMPLVSAIESLFRNKNSNENLFISSFTIKVSRIDSLIADSYKIQRSYLGQLMIILLVLAGTLLAIQPFKAVAGVNSQQESMYGVCLETRNDERFQSEQMQSLDE